MSDTKPSLPLERQLLTYPIADGVDAWQLAQFAKHARRPMLILTAEAQSAQRLYSEMAFFSAHLKVCLFPDWETLPYDPFSPHRDLVSERLSTLWQLRQQSCDVILLALTTAMTRLPPIPFLVSRSFLLKVGEPLNVEKLRADLILAGYQAVTQVMAPGEFSIRGGLIDLFAMGSALPYRIDLFDNEIETLRTFDPDTQRTLYAVREINLLPAREYPTDDEAISLFRQRYREYVEGDLAKSRIYRDVSAQLFPAGIEYYLPLFFTEMATIFDYLGHDALVILHRDIALAADIFWREIKARYDMARGDTERPILAPETIFLRPDELLRKVKNYPRIALPKPDNPVSSLPELALDRRAQAPLYRLDAFLQSYTGRVLLLAESIGRREVMLQLLLEQGFKPTLVESWQHFIDDLAPFSFAVGPLYSGFILDQLSVTVITETELYQHIARSHTHRARAKGQSDARLRDLAEIKMGDPVVHEQHGIGRYMGLVALDLGEGLSELMQLEYADGALLYVPVAQLHFISRYAGGSREEVILHRLGSAQWEKARRRAAQKAHDTAAELLELYAQRAARQGHTFDFSVHDYEQFAAGFGFEETPDQAQAISTVIADMCSGKPMDRLVCGDVGFGKTEVALRAAFVAVFGGKQVAVLVPTTLLAEQHFQNFSDRFADWPTKIAELSRFRSAKDNQQVLEQLANGRIDIVIGTHKLVQPHMKFHNLGLVIIDEEHRFGVRQKEQLKQLRADVDVLTLTATPIPRTLSMALEGLRDFSVIATAPSRRLAVKTFISPLNNGLVREAILRELKRGGQVFFLHNAVETINMMHDTLVHLVPEARIAVAHGQLRERQLEQVMRDFLQQRFNVLLCSTIIETGIDIPNANTILINRADKFGLAQLHQLRGRVGRSHHQAYAYLLTPEHMTKDAVKRLEAIALSEELGAGFYLAMHDLEIRGAGEVLGDEQSGEMQEVGFTLFTEMLKQAVDKLKKGQTPHLEGPLQSKTEINLHSPALLPPDYCPDIHERLVLYKKLAASEHHEEIDALYEELVDRFGLLPPATKTLIDSHRLRLVAQTLGIQKLDASDKAIQLFFYPNPPLDPTKIIQLVQTQRHYSFAGKDKLRVAIEIPDVALRVDRIKALFKELRA